VVNASSPSNGSNTSTAAPVSSDSRYRLAKTGAANAS
jgi:hypothetical protein